MNNPNDNCNDLALNCEETNYTQAKKAKVGRPCKVPNQKMCPVAVTIFPSQKEWLDELTASNAELSISKIVREALDLWYEEHNKKTSFNSEQGLLTYDDYDYSWR